MTVRPSPPGPRPPPPAGAGAPPCASPIAPPTTTNAAQIAMFRMTAPLLRIDSVANYARAARGLRPSDLSSIVIIPASGVSSRIIPLVRGERVCDRDVIPFPIAPSSLHCVCQFAWAPARDCGATRLAVHHELHVGGSGHAAATAHAVVRDCGGVHQRSDQ